MTVEEFYKHTSPIITELNAFAQKHSLTGRAKADHVCYKCGTRESFEKLRTMFERESDYIYQSIISDRPIAIVRMKRGIETMLGTIYYLELSDQKKDNSQKERFDHIEVYPVGWGYDAMVQELQKGEVVKEVKRPHHSTHDITMGQFLFRMTHGPLIEKIQQEEMRQKV
jgi:predicted metalloenzyme YecM